MWLIKTKRTTTVFGDNLVIAFGFDDSTVIANSSLGLSVVTALKTDAYVFYEKDIVEVINKASRARAGAFSSSYVGALTELTMKSFPTQGVVHPAVVKYVLDDFQQNYCDFVATAKPIQNKEQNHVP